MSYPVFSDFDKSAADIIADDFEAGKFYLKVKTPGPFNSTVTTTNTYDKKDGKIKPKVSTKVVHPSGFTLKKLDVSPDCSFSLESGLTGVTEGLELEFKGNDKDKGDLSFTYKMPSVATFTGDFDLCTFSSVKASVLGGTGPLTAGASADVKFAKSSFDKATFALGVGYEIPKMLFCGVRATENLTKFGVKFKYVATPEVLLAGNVDYSSKGPDAVLAAQYTCVPGTTMKAKASTTGVFSACLKQQMDKKLTGVASLEVPSSLKDVKFGLSATLG